VGDQCIDGRIILKIDAKETGCKDMDWIYLVHVRFH
jgi:hypothetical protein